MPAKSREPGVTTEDVAALVGSPETSPEAPARPPKPKLSEGIRVDLEMRGTTTDPNTGDRLDRDPDTGVITVTDRDGNTHTL